MPPKKPQKDQLPHQTAVRYNDEDAAYIEELIAHTRRPKAEIFRYAIRLYHRIAEEAHWDLNIHGEPRPPREPDHPVQSHAPPPRGKAIPS